MKNYAPPNNRVGRMERLVMALREHDTGYLDTLKTFDDVRTIVYNECDLDEMAERIADMIEEVLEAE